MDKDFGRRVSRFGPLVSWNLDLGAKQPLVTPCSAALAAP
jgi:hypothetical protein